MRRILLIITLFFISLNTFAVSQHPDYIIYKGDTLPLFTNPLESYLKAKNIEFKDISQERYWGMEYTRGYIAYFEIKDNKLYLVDLIATKHGVGADGRCNHTDITIMKSVFPNNKACFIKEFSGLLRIPLGEEIKHIDKEYLSEYSSYRCIEIKNGEVLIDKKLSNKKYKALKEKQYKNYILTEEFKKEVEGFKHLRYSELIKEEGYIDYLYTYFEPSLGKEKPKIEFYGVRF